mmetsp:Transcript_13056/g.24187  ORF Transcript_13056/g.24187 Transcript_13056/m.24187 type:complete len:311 (-) Transcript_13056:140-1072(-)
MASEAPNTKELAVADPAEGPSDGPVSEAVAVATESTDSAAAASQLDLLQSCVQSLEASVGSAFQRMSGSLATSLSMMDSMNGMMEEYVLRGVVLKANAGLKDHQTGTWKVTLQVGNEGRLPIADVFVQADLVMLRGEKQQCITSETMTLDPNKSFLLKGSATLEREDDLVTELSVTFKFPSPGTGKELSKTEAIPILLWDQLEFVKEEEVVTEDLFEDEAVSVHCVSLHPELVRQYLRVPPLKGLPLPSMFRCVSPRTYAALFVCARCSSDSEGQVELCFASKDMSHDQLALFDDDVAKLGDRGKLPDLV